MGESTDLKTCSVCGEDKPVGAFPSRGGKCRGCVNAQMRQYRRDNPEKFKAYDAKRYASQGDKRRAAGRDYYRRNKESRSAYSRRRYRSNRQKFIAAAGAWSRAHPEKMAVYHRTYREKNPDMARVTNQNRRTRLAGRTVSRAELDSIWTGDCALCGDPIDRALKFPNLLSRSVDHIIPLAKGGEHVIANLQWTHYGCNCRKSDKVA